MLEHIKGINAELREQLKGMRDEAQTHLVEVEKQLSRAKSLNTSSGGKDIQLAVVETNLVMIAEANRQIIDDITRFLGE